MLMMSFLAAAMLLAAALALQGSTHLSWIFPGDFRERLRMTGDVVSVTIKATIQQGLTSKVRPLRGGSSARFHNKGRILFECQPLQPEFASLSGIPE